MRGELKLVRPADAQKNLTPFSRGGSSSSSKGAERSKEDERMEQNETRIEQSAARSREDDGAEIEAEMEEAVEHKRQRFRAVIKRRKGIS